MTTKEDLEHAKRVAPLGLAPDCERGSQGNTITDQLAIRADTEVPGALDRGRFFAPVVGQVALPHLEQVIDDASISDEPVVLGLSFKTVRQRPEDYMDPDEYRIFNDTGIVPLRVQQLLDRWWIAG